MIDQTAAAAESAGATTVVHRRIAELAAARPDAAAVTDGHTTLSYRDLDEQANRLAQVLRRRVAGPDVVVGVCLPRTPRLLIALLAVLKAGAAYLPLDTSYPPERLRRLLSEARPPLLITDGSTRTGLPTATGSVVDLDRDAKQIAAQPGDDPTVPVRPDNLAYVIYTSGSTGTPKGVMVAHRALAALVDWHLRAYRITGGDRCAHLAAFGFDASVWEIWPVLASGASLQLPADTARTRPDLLARWLAEHRITVTFLPTPLAQELLRVPEHRSLRTRAILVGGDALTAAPPAGTPFEIVNHYGPTEAAVVATAGLVAQGAADVPSIGSEVDHVQAHLLDEKLRPVPLATPGELYLGGSALARGYLDRPALTADRFVADPFGSGTRLFRTGDIARRRADGALDFLGRRDDQVSLRGVRIELGEVTARLRAHSDVADATVVLRKAPNELDQLVAYVVPVHARIDPAAVLADLRRILPSAMVPAIAVPLPRFPLTAHGKVDRAALPAPLVGDEVAALPPRDDLEALIADIWYQVLGLPDRRPNVHEDFLALGGHSLLATQLVARFRDVLGIDLPAQAAISASTIAGLAELIRSGQADPEPLNAVARLRRQIDDMSDEQVERLLAELGGEP
ncbi:non-ribosomal peptide synthetase [Nocardia ninae]|uniref:Carrier domain-containing protein n=1 Tax=Nocardia ninae NBRC 108245 TaxID=1210091 RepID=A0A511MGM7_9NOCA|nr:non-ribosomal peptide synthetase [Nocardia ninae]GEM39804.1 hypothetical protein NN4_43230 [Nocardia ninae NBRC 108245]